MLSLRSLALAALAIAAFSPPAKADARSRLKVVRYSVTAQGSQTTSWTLDHTEFDGCVQGDVRSVGSGRETVSFKSRRAATVLAMAVGGDVLLTSPGSVPGVPVKGAVTRSGHIDVQQLSGGESACGGGDPSSQPSPPDCGSKPFSGVVTPVWTKPDDYPGEPPVPLVPVLLLEGPYTRDGSPAFDLFHSCPSSGLDALLPTPTSALPRKRLFGSARSFTVKGRDSQVSDSDGFHAETTVRWTATFRRLKGAGSPPPRGAPPCADGRDNDRDGKVDFPRDGGCSSPTDRSE